jgi:hypothetical protein
MPCWLSRRRAYVQRTQRHHQHRPRRHHDHRRLASCLFLSAVDFTGWGDERPILAHAWPPDRSSLRHDLCLLLAFARSASKPIRPSAAPPLTCCTGFRIVLILGDPGTGPDHYYIPTWIRITPDFFGLDPLRNRLLRTHCL